MNPSRLEALKQEIAAAFADVPYPGDERIAYNHDDWEGARLSDAFKGKHWGTLTLQELREHDMYFLSHDGFRYYLPAYLLASLSSLDDPLREEILPTTVYGLTLFEGDTPEDQMLRQGRLTRFGVFTPAQTRAIRSFLEYVRDERPDAFLEGDAPREALERYWGRDWP
jgi:hypothetical protein